MSVTGYLCRSCLITDENVLSINDVLEENLRIMDCFNIHLDMNMSECDELPSNICQTCLFKLLAVRKFHLKCLESEKFLRKSLGNSVHPLNNDLQKNEVIISHTAVNVDSELSNGDTVVGFLDATEKCNSEQNEDIEHEVLNTPELDDGPSHDQLLEIETITDDDELEISENEDEQVDRIGVPTETSSILDPIEVRRGRKPVYCLQCHQEFSTKNNLRKHFISVHSTDNERGRCMQCSKTFPTRGKLMSHLHTHKRPALRFQCTYCDKLFPERHKLGCHIRTHTGERPFICAVCKKGFTQKSALTTHMTLHTGKKVPCPQCEKTFSRTAFLTLHLRVHNNERPFACDICNKKFRLKGHLKEHLHTHSNVKIATCDTCGQTFKRESSLRMHMYSHTRNPYKCPVCPMEYKKLHVFRKHLTQIHDIHDDPKLYKRKEMDDQNSGTRKHINDK